MAFMTKRVGRGEKKGGPEVGQRRRIVLHEERSLCHASSDQTRCSKQKECKSIEIRNERDVEMLSLTSWTVARHTKMTFTSLAFIGVAAILLLFSSGVKGECVDRVVIVLERPE
jgi:hypothetical protein